MIIAQHHQHKDPDYTPTCAWSEKTYVQWGGSGIVLSKNSYRTAFFEAFPEDKLNVGGFIRGEGKTIKDAEINAFGKYKNQSACDHLWGREHYKNSGQLCRHCRGFRSGFVKELYIDGQFREPLNSLEVSSLHLYDTPSEFRTFRLKNMKQDELTQRNKRIKLLRLRKNLFGVKEYPSEKKNRTEK